MMKFEQLFNEIFSEEISEDVFTLTGKIFPVITAGTKEHYNSILAGRSRMEVLFKKPATWSIFQTTRYTLELIEKVQIFFLGSKSVRDSAK
jgi:hypothetical protein